MNRTSYSSRWDAQLYTVAGLLDRLAMASAWIIAKLLPGRLTLSAGVFFYPTFQPFWGTWADASGRTVRMGRIELQVAASKRR